MFFRKTVDSKQDVIIFNNYHHQEYYFGEKIFSGPEGDFYMYPEDVDPEKLSYLLMKLEVLNPEEIPSIKKIKNFVDFTIIKGKVTENCIRMILL